MTLLNVASLLGKSVGDAEKICANFGYHIRITKQDGLAFVVTCDLRTNRVNVSVSNGFIDSASIG